MYIFICIALLIQYQKYHKSKDPKDFDTTLLNGKTLTNIVSLACHDNYVADFPQ